MATFTSNSYEGRYLQLTITESVDVIGNSSTLTWTLKCVGGSVNYYSTAATTVKINGTQVYYKGATSWDSYEFPAAKGTVSGTIKVAHNSDGSKTGVEVVFNTRVYYSTVNSYGGTIDLTKIDRSAPTVSLSTSSVTASSVIITATSTAKADIWDYSIDNGSTWSRMSTTAGTSASKTITGLSPNTSYNIKVRARREYNQVYGTSSAKSVKTLGNSLLNSVNTFTVDVASPVLTMNWTVYAAYTHTLVIKEGNTTVLTITGLTCSTGTNNKTVTLTAAQRTTILQYMSSKQSFEATFYLTTYSGTTQIGSTVSKTATIQTTSGTSAPTFSGFTHKDSDKSGTLAITGNDQIYIKGYSSLQIVIGTKSAKNEASISSYKVTVGSDSKSFTTTTIEYGTISVSGNVTLKVEVIDSRGYSTAITKNITVIDYEDISITDYTIRRKNEVEATVQLAFSGNIAPITIDGEAQNGVVSAKFRYAPNGGSWSGWSNLTVAETTRNFEYATLALSNSSGVLEFNPNSQYTIDIKITDRLSSDTMTIILNKGTPLVAFRAKKVGINTPDPQDALDVREGNIRMNGYVIQGFVADLGNTEDLHDLIHNGIWTQHLNANASTDRHYPVAKAGYLEVFENPQGYVLQRYTTFDCSGIYICYRYNDEWSAWRSITIS